MRAICIASLVLVTATISGSVVFAQAAPPLGFESADKAPVISVPEDPEQWLRETERATVEELKGKIRLAKQQRIQALRQAIERAEMTYAAGVYGASIAQILEMKAKLAEAEYENEPTPEKLLIVKRHRWEAILYREKAQREQVLAGTSMSSGDNLDYIISQRLQAEADYLQEVFAQRAKQKAEK